MQVEFGGYTCNVLFGQYMHGGSISIQLVDERDGQPVATATINPEIPLKSGLVAIKDYSENSGMLKALVDAGFVSEPVSYYQSGFVTVPVCQLLKMPEIAGKDVVTGEDISEVRWVVHGDTFKTFEFETKADIWIEEQSHATDYFRLVIYTDGTISIFTAFDEDYDIGDEVTRLFDVDSIQAVCEAAEPDIDDLTKEYNEHYAEREEE